MRKTVVIGITGSIAATKIPILVKLLKRSNLSVETIMTRAASRLISPAKFSHLEIAKNTALFVVAPATANTIAKIAHGVADNLLTTSLLATKAPVLICPAMNTSMWQHPQTQENIARLKTLGYHVMAPEKGKLACGDFGFGRLPEPKTIKTKILSLLKIHQSLKGKKILVTAGATREPIDNVRFISNPASGKMGAAVALNCAGKGAQVSFLKAANATEALHPNITQQAFTTTKDLQKLLKVHVPKHHIIFHTAAVSDFKVKNPQKGKTKSTQPPTVHLETQVKLSDEIKQLNPKIKLILFKAEWGGSEKQIISSARVKLEDARADAVIANDISRQDRGFAVNANQIIIIPKTGPAVKLPLSSKLSLAEKLISKLL